MSKFLLAFIAYSILAQAGLVSARLLVLTTGPDGCSARKVAKIKTALGEVTQMADAAITALANPQVINSPAFLDFLGKGNNPTTISANKYQKVKTVAGGALGELAFLTGAGANDVTFICPPDDEELKAANPENPAAAQSTEKCNGFFFALARNGPPNIVRVCPSFFDNRSIKLASGAIKEVTPNPLATAARLHTTGGKIGACPSLTLIHEFQHLKAVVGNDIALDLESSVDPISGPPPPPAPGSKAPKVKNPAYTVDQCKGLPPASKIQNAQNFAWFAFDVFADKTRAVPCGTPPASPVASNSRSGSPKPPAKPVVRRAKVVVAPKKKVATVAAPKKNTPPKVAAPKVAAPKVAVPKKVAPVAAPKKAAPVVAAPKKAAPVVAAPKKAAPVTSAPKKVAAPAPKPNPLGGGTVPSGSRLARPARASSTLRPTATAAAGAKKGAKVGATSTSAKKAAATGKAAPACKVLRRAIIQPISTDGEFVG